MGDAIGNLLNTQYQNIGFDDVSFHKKAVDYTDKPIIKKAKKVEDFSKKAFTFGKQCLIAGDNYKAVQAKVQAKYARIDNKVYARLDNLSNVLGKVLVDCSAIDKNSKIAHKSYVAYAMNCTCPKNLKKVAAKTMIADGTIDAVLANNTIADTYHTIPVCAKTKLPILASPQDFSKSDVKKIAKTLIAEGTLNRHEIKACCGKADALSAIKAIFNLIDIKNITNDYSDKIDVSEHILDNNTDLETEINQFEIQDVDTDMTPEEIAFDNVEMVDLDVLLDNDMEEDQKHSEIEIVLDDELTQPIVDNEIDNPELNETIDSKTCLDVDFDDSDVSEQAGYFDIELDNGDFDLEPQKKTKKIDINPNSFEPGF